MNKRQIIALFSCLVIGMIGFIGAYSVENSRPAEDQTEENTQQEPSRQTSTVIPPQLSTARTNPVGASSEKETQSASQETEAAQTMAPSELEQTASAEQDRETEAAGEETETVETTAEVKSDALHFAPEDGLRWPLEGDVLLNYSMDHRIYFPTLQQYQYNPALVIGGDVNSKVYIIAKGTITDISTNEVTGCTVTEDLGDGYTAVYGQLKELNFSVGDKVERGQVIGYISEPTKYYSLEGSNLYFALEKDGEPVDPLEYYE